MASPFPASDSLHARARAFVTAFERGASPPEPFDALACDLARFQAAHIPGYARLCHAHGVDVASLVHAADVPAVPTDAFKLTRVATFPSEADCNVFRTSGTTLGRRGAHAMRDPRTYDAAAVAFGRWALAEDLAGRRAPMVVLGPSPAEAPDSSLTHMIEAFAAAFGDGPALYCIEDGVLDLIRLDARVAHALTAGEDAMIVFATSFALVHLLDALSASPFRLPPRTRVMQTGGFKGRAREVDAATLRRDCARAFHIGERAFVSEYGMTELSSQFYEATWREPAARVGVYREPPWARVVPVDPDTLSPVPFGEVGIARIEDLMNVDSAVAVLAADRVRRVEGGFALLGRASSAPPRGCSIAIDEMLS